MILFLIFHARKIDVLNLFHLNWNSLLFAFCYKMINPNGVTYLKLDNCCFSGKYDWEQIFYSDIQTSKPFKTKLKNFLIKEYLIKKIDLWSIEDPGSKLYYEKKYSFFENKLTTVYNGHTVDLFNMPKVKPFSKKKNILLSVGRFGSYQKATEILFESFKQIANKYNWQLHLAGTLTTDFKNFTELFFRENPQLKNRIIFHGQLKKKDLFNLYNDSKIFCLPSRYEGFANVFSEAMYFRNAIITTPYTSIKEILLKKHFGLLVEKDDYKSLAIAMSKLINNNELSEEYGNNAYRFAIKYLNWDRIVNKLASNINNI